ncbi:MAG: flagellar biosynthesis protein FlhA [Eubacteriales bacterium]|nr:flagellar biosynthesis protein FlhA [Eubacteriales bacterium]MDD3198256.1 flagellar biosynthesis protein FlhA [Eubacteriales bacterium]MDD4683500.1 flagellar biosynthesis protein FlhA [Eubacteriales bacterium]
MKFADILIAGVVFVVIILIIVPLSPVFLDFLLVVNISLAVTVLLLSLFTKEALDFSVFPPLLLILTLFRLALNISSTRLILGNNGEAGAVIKTFGGFVIGGNIVVGVIIFAIIIIIQFLVITKGSERVAEVAARFTLDAMPGKQMAIDADLNSGLIDEQQAKVRRSKIQREADFYGAMDGASKFVKGDAIVSILVTIINIVGGIVIGMMTSDLAIEEVIAKYTLATVGDGLVSQIPALMISTATGIIVTRAASEDNLGAEISSQLFSQPTVLYAAGVIITALSLIPGLPKLPIWMIGIFMVVLATIIRRNILNAQAVPAADTAVEEIARESRKPENVVSLLGVDPIELEFGYGLIPLADANQGGDLSDRVVMIRRQCAMDLGLIIPGIRLRDNVLLKTNEYVVRIRGEEIARGEIMADHYLAMNAEESRLPIKGIETVEPAFGLPALWISRSEREKAELAGYTIVDPPSVLATHLSELLKRHANELLDRQQVQTLVDNLKQSQPALVDEVIPKLFTLGEVQKVLSGLLREGVSIRDMGTILETLSDYSGATRNPDMLIEYCRQRLKRTISKRFVGDGIARVITLDPQLEQLIIERLRQTEQGSFVALSPDQIQKLLHNLRSALERMMSVGINPVVLTSPAVRPHFKKMVEQMSPELAVLSYNEIDAAIEIHAEGMVSISNG